MCKLCMKDDPSIKEEDLTCKFAIEFAIAVKEYAGEYPCRTVIQNARCTIRTTSISVDEYIMMRLRKTYIIQKLKKEKYRSLDGKLPISESKLYNSMYAKYNIEQKTISRSIQQRINKATGTIQYEVGKTKNRQRKIFTSLEDAITYRDA